MQNMSFILYRRALINENKWRASRYGLDGKMIDFGIQQEKDTRSLIVELLEFIDDVVDDLGSRKAIEHVYAILRDGTGADRQLDVYSKKGNLVSVVDYITEQTLVGV